MKNIELLRLQLNHLINQARHDIYMLSSISDATIKQQTLQRLWDALSSIHFLSELLANQSMPNHSLVPLQQKAPDFLGNANQPQVPPIPPLPNQPANQRTFTIQELTNYDGKNGRPAYVAVNGLIYDVTNNRAWAAATHFALTAGKDYTKEFASCHAGQQSILATLPIVGRIA